MLDQLEPLGELQCRAMFGGYGLYCRKVFFGIVFNGRLYFKTDSKSRLGYLRAGTKALRPNSAQTLKTYYEVPVDVLEDGDELARWGRRAVLSSSRRGQA